MVSSSIFSRKGQAVGENSASSAAFLILIIAVLIIIYILFLPATEREALLSSGTVPGTTPGSSTSPSYLIGAVPLNVNVGLVEYISSAQVDLLMNSFKVFTKTDAALIEIIESLYIKNSAFQTRTREINFYVDRSNTQNLVLAFNVDKAYGDLIIHFNGENIFEGELQRGSPAPIQIPARLIKNENSLYFSVSSPGFAFWRVNEYSIKNLRITADLTDRTHTANTQKIFIASSDFKHIDKAELSFFPDCTQASIGNVAVIVNKNELFNGVLDCGITNRIQLGKPYLLEGENTITFQTDKGSFIIDGPKLSLDLNEPEYPTYYFNLHEDLFNYAIDNETGIGYYTDIKDDINLILQSFFVDESYKKVDFNINGNLLPIDTHATQIYRNINIYVREGINSIQVQPRNDIAISQLRVVVQ
jgi:hypothetical protein